MRLIKVSTDLEMTVHEYPTGTYDEQRKVLCELIGNGCDTLEPVRPKRLYTEARMSSKPSREPGKCVCMLIDEEGMIKPNKLNPLGCYLYRMDIHGWPIVGNILFVGEVFENDGIGMCGISEEYFQRLERELNYMIREIKR